MNLSFFKEKKNAIFYIFFSIIVILAAVIRFNGLEYPSSTEVHRDYLVSRHIVEYGEFPLTGASNSVIPGFRASPTYPYFWAGFLFFSDDVVFLSIVNIFLQLFGLVVLFYFAKVFFGIEAALLAGLFYTFANQFIMQSYYPWQPHTMQPFLLLSFLLLTLGYFRNSPKYVDWGVVIFIFSASFHYSALALMPVFVAAIFYIYRNMGSLRRIYRTVLIGIISFLAFYLPNIYNFFNLPSKLQSIDLSVIFINSPSSFFNNLFFNSKKFISLFYYESSHWAHLNEFLLIVTSLVVFIYFFLQSKSRKKITFFYFWGWFPPFFYFIF